jgi:hypothetical protein
LIQALTDFTSLMVEARQQNIDHQIASVLALNDELAPKALEALRRDVLQKLRRHGGSPEDPAIETLYDLNEHIDKLLRVYAGCVLTLSTVELSGQAIFKLSGPISTKVKQDEWNALDIVLWLSRKGLVHRIQRCQNPACGQWFYAGFDHQTTCKDKCRRGKYRSSEKWKAHHRDKQREYYRLHKNTNVVTRGGK